MPAFLDSCASIILVDSTHDENEIIKNYNLDYLNKLRKLSFCYKASSETINKIISSNGPLIACSAGTTSHELTTGNVTSSIIDYFDKIINEIGNY